MLYYLYFFSWGWEGRTEPEVPEFAHVLVHSQQVWGLSALGGLGHLMLVSSSPQPALPMQCTVDGPLLFADYFKSTVEKNRNPILK